MIERVSDKDLDSIETEASSSCGDFGDNPKLRALVHEVRQHRARIAAHAEAHPERLSDDVVNDRLASLGKYGRANLLPRESLEYDELLEIQQRRAADLTPDQIDAIAAWRPLAIYDQLDHQDAMDAIDTLLAAYGARP